MPDILPRKSDYMLNMMHELTSHEKYMTYMKEYLLSETLSKNEFTEQIKLEVSHFLIEEERLMRRIAERINAPYIGMKVLRGPHSENMGTYLKRG